MLKRLHLQLISLKWRRILQIYCCALWIIAVSIILITNFVVLYGHHFWCFDSECRPISHALIQFQEIAPLRSFETDLQPLSNEISNIEISNIIIFDSLSCINEIDASSISLALIIGQRRGGTSWMRHILMTHSQIVDLEEILRIWFNENCSQFAFLLESEARCTADSMISAITTAFTMELEEYYCSNNKQITVDSKSMVFIGKIQIEQIAGDFMESLMEFVVLNEIKILHFQRGAVIASFLSYSMDQMERVSNFRNQRDFDDLVERSRLNVNNKKMSQTAIHLTPSLAVDYVQKIEAKHKEFKDVVLRTQGMLHYMEVFYESLMDTVNSNNVAYLRMIESFLGIDAEITSTDVGDYQREHPLPCYQKIRNWNEISSRLNDVGSMSVIACQNAHS